MFDYSNASKEKRTPSSFYRLSVQRKCSVSQLNLITLFHFLRHAQSSWMNSAFCVNHWEEKKKNQRIRTNATTQGRSSSVFLYAQLLHFTRAYQFSTNLFGAHTTKDVFCSSTARWLASKQLAEIHRQTFHASPKFPFFYDYDNVCPYFLNVSYLPQLCTFILSFYLLLSLRIAHSDGVVWVCVEQ